MNQTIIDESSGMKPSANYDFCCNAHQQMIIILITMMVAVFTIILSIWCYRNKKQQQDGYTASGHPRQYNSRVDRSDYQEII